MGRVDRAHAVRGDPVALATTPHVDPATGETVWVVEGLGTCGGGSPANIVMRLGMEYRARAVVKDDGTVVWVLEVRRGDETPTRPSSPSVT